ncbi:MAG: ATP-dependent helicase [Dehalococcoidales bacterium]|nr:ATP-dependent helicase [Dehalococcoidales bacterium]
MTSIEDILEQELTPGQRDAASDPAAEVLTLACAGSGKSKTLAYRIARIVAEGQNPSSIVAFTFTVKAADSIKLQVSRAIENVGLDPAIIGAMYIGTIHSYCEYVLTEMNARYRQFDVLDPNRLRLYLISRYGELGLYRLRARARRQSYFDTVNQVAEAWATMNDEGIAIGDVVAEDPELGELLSNLAAYMNRDEFIDFSLMIRRAADALAGQDPDALRAVRDLRHLMVDEYQDVNPAQEELIRQLHRHSQTLFVVGDDDQAIYAWRGADVGNILTFQERYPGASQHTLSFNFRSTRAIVRTADEFAAQQLGATRTVKNPEAEDPEGPRDYRVLWFPDREHEAEWVIERIRALLGTAYRERDGTVRGLTPADFAILMRSTRTAEQNGEPRHAAFTRRLGNDDIPFSLEQGGGIFERPEVRVLSDTLETLRNGTPDRDSVRELFRNSVEPAYPHADFNRLAAVLTDWGRRIHAPPGGPRQRIYPQMLVHDLLAAFGLAESDFGEAVLLDLGVFSRIMQDVEAVYMSIDSASRFGEVLNFLHHVAETGYDTGTSELQVRPDAVTVSTVHRVKGLEFPVVVVADVENGRFPGRRHDYDGWIPGNLIADALQRGAYQSTIDEEARLFYTALTRAERFLYVAGSEWLPDGRRARNRSRFALYLRDEEISDDPVGLPEGLRPETPVRRLEETSIPTSFSDISYYLRCPRDYQMRRVFGFSPAIAEMFGFGMTIHAAISRLHQQFPDSMPTGEAAEEIAREIFHLKHVPQSADPESRPGAYERAQARAAEIVRAYVEAYGDDFAHRRQVEARFEIPVGEAAISGSIDLIIREDTEGNILDASVLEYKTLEGGQVPEEEESLHWTDLSTQVQLYAKAAREVLGENTRTGAVHLLRDNQRIDVPVSDEAVNAAVANVEWAVERILDSDFPRRPRQDKCNSCDFKALCSLRPESFKTNRVPPPIHTPAGARQARAFSEYEEG